MKVSTAPLWLRWPALVVIVVIVSGCAALGARLEPSEIVLSALRVQDVTGLEAAFAVDLRVLNRSEHPLSIQGIDCRLTLDESHLARGVAGVQQDIPAYGSGIVTVTVYSSILDMVPVIRRLVQQAREGRTARTWTYAMEGHLRLAGAGPWNRINFDTRGELDPAAVGGAP